jgi:hypothetical protein
VNLEYYYNPLFKEEAKMKFYNKQHAYYCGIDLHAKTMYVCIQDKNGEVLVHRNIRACPKVFLKTIRPYQEDIVVAVECMPALLNNNCSYRRLRNSSYSFKYYSLGFS